YLESHKGSESRHYLLDFGFTPDVYANNLGLLKVDVAKVDALIISHGHYDHVGGLIGFLETHRSRMRKDLRLYTGGEDNFCNRFLRNPDGRFTDFGTPFDRRKHWMCNPCCPKRRSWWKATRSQPPAEPRRETYNQRIAREITEDDARRAAERDAQQR